MAKRRPFFGLNEPLRHDDHGRPRTRRDFIAQGFQAGMGTVLGTSILGLPGMARGLSIEQSVIDACGIRFDGAGKIPFICFDLAGGANIAGSNVLMGKRNGQLDFLDTGGYEKLGLPSSMIPSAMNAGAPNNSFIDTTLGLAFHTDSGFLRGILEKTSPATQALINGSIIAARSENDTGNNPHNPMYGINLAGARGSLLALCGSQSSESGGNSMAPAMLINNEVRPTKVDRPTDVTGLVDVGDLVGLLDQEEVVAVMESMYHMSKHKMDRVATTDAIRQAVPCKYLESAGLAERYSNPASLNPLLDPDIVGPTGIFNSTEINDGEFRKTASVMKLVVEGYAGAGTITMGGYDYHTGDRATGEQRDLRAGRCMGACLEYAARKNKPLMMYVFSDGSVFSNGMIDNSAEGRGKGVWTGDNQQTAASFFLVYNPGFRPVLLVSGAGDRPERHQQIGYMRPSGDVETSSSPAANNVNQLVQTVILNYMALHGEQGNFGQLFASHGLSHGLGSAASMDALTAFEPIVNSPT
jgi:hypothetical protein